MMVGWEGVEKLKQRIAGLGLEESLPIDLRNRLLTIFQGCRPDQVVNEKFENENGRHPFMGALCAEKASLRLNRHQEGEGVEHDEVVITFPLKVDESH